jgi:hypothetical protein
MRNFVYTLAIGNEGIQPDHRAPVHPASEILNASMPLKAGYFQSIAARDGSQPIHFTAKKV